MTVGSGVCNAGWGLRWSAPVRDSISFLDICMAVRSSSLSFLFAWTRNVIVIVVLTMMMVTVITFSAIIAMITIVTIRRRTSERRLNARCSEAPASNGVSAKTPQM